jgi:hypothetical protein
MDRNRIENAEINQYLSKVRAQLKGCGAAWRDEQIEELRQHLDALINDQLACGLSPSEAALAAIRKLGDSAKIGRGLFVQWIKGKIIDFVIAPFAIPVLIFYPLFVIINATPFQLSVHEHMAADTLSVVWSLLFLLIGMGRFGSNSKICLGGLLAIDIAYCAIIAPLSGDPSMLLLRLSPLHVSNTLLVVIGLLGLHFYLTWLWLKYQPGVKSNRDRRLFRWLDKNQ